MHGGVNMERVGIGKGLKRAKGGDKIGYTPSWRYNIINPDH